MPGTDNGKMMCMSRVTSEYAVEPVTGIEPAPSAWEAEILPLNYTGLAPTGAKGSLAEAGREP